MTVKATLEGLPIRNARSRLVLHVMPGDISRRSRKNPAKCALAAACARQEQVPEVRVYLSRAYVKHLSGQYWIRYEVSQAAQREIISFDRGARFEPGEYCLNPVSPAKIAGGYNKAPTGTGQRRLGTRVVTTNIRAQAPTTLKGSSRGR